MYIHTCSYSHRDTVWVIWKSTALWSLHSKASNSSKCQIALYTQSSSQSATQWTSDVCKIILLFFVSIAEVLLFKGYFFCSLPLGGRWRMVVSLDGWFETQTQWKKRTGHMRRQKCKLLSKTEKLYFLQGPRRKYAAYVTQHTWCIFFFTISEDFKR